MELATTADISKKEFFTCKITGKVFNDVGNFGKHLRKLGIDYVDYCHKFYYDRIPTCLVTGLPSDNPVNGYFMRWHLLSKKYKHLQRKIAANLTKLSKIPDRYKTKFITYEYWMDCKSYSIEDAYNKIHFLVSSERELYKRLVSEYFDDTWTQAGIEKYVNDIIDGRDSSLKTLFSVDGWLQRGWDDDVAEELRNKYIKDNLKTHLRINYWTALGYSEEDSVKKISQIQTANTNKLHTKYNKTQFRQLSVRCKEYWIARGYSEDDARSAISAAQSTFSLDKCIQKYGKQLGLEIFESRQKKWQQSLISNNDMVELNAKKGKNLYERMNLYGELPAKKWFAKRYWGIDISTLDEFSKYEKVILGDYTRKFYNREYRKLIIKSQNHLCGNPTCKVHHTTCVFDLHHIDYDKSNDSRNNLIFLCKSCHSKTTATTNRQYWVDFYFHVNEVFCAKPI